MSVSVAEDFQPGSFIQVARDNLIESEGKFDNVFVHFNVSPYGPLEEFGVFLYNLLAWGIVVDKRTGEVFYVGSNLNWYIAVEISAAPEGDDTCPFDTVEKVKGVIPLVEAFFEPEKVEEIKLDTESEDFLTCLGGFALSYPETPEFPDLGKKRKSKLLEIRNLYEFKSKLETHDKKGKFSIFAEDFIRFLETLFDEGQPKTTAILARLVKLISDRFRALSNHCDRQYQKIGDFFVRFYNSLEIEMRQFTKVPLEAPTAYILIQGNGKDKKGFIMDFTEDNALEKKKEEAGFPMLQIMKLEEIRRDPNVLYDLLNDVFGIPNSMELLNGAKHGMTPEFARDLVFMRQCLGAGQNVVLPERPGVPELLETFTVLANSGIPLKIEGAKTFLSLQMNPSVTAEMFREWIARIAKVAEEVIIPRGKKPWVVVLIEGCSSTSVMGMVKEVLVDGTLNGVRLPENIFFVGTCRAGPDARPLPPSLRLLEVKL